MRLQAPILALALLAPGAALAQVRCPDDRAAVALAGEPVERRIEFLRDRLEAERGSARAWTWSFGLVNGGLTAGQLAGAVVVRRSSDRALLLAGAATSALGVGQILFAPITPSRRALEEGGDGPCLQLRRLEDELSRRARNERVGSGTAAQLGNLVINVGFGLAAGLLAHRALPGLATFGLGWGLGELQILTEPTGLVDALEDYRAGRLGAGGPGASRGGWSVWAAGPTVGLRFEF